MATQLVTVEDTMKPTFIVPKDTTVNCGSTDTSFTGVPTNVADDCDADPNLTFSDTQAAGSCTGEFTITRAWRLEDTCGNVLIQNQIINSIDTIAPMITTEAMDTIYDCSGTSANTAFNNWLMTCLLYTSPSPRDATLSRMPSSA